MDRRAKVVVIAERIEAARGKLAKQKAERDAQDRERDEEEMKPDDYRKEHGRCPDGYEYDPFEDKCLEREPQPGEPADEPEPEKDEPTEEPKDEKPEPEGDKPADAPKEGEAKKFKPADTPEGRKKQRQERRAKLRKLMDTSPKEYKKEVARMRASGELPDRKTSEMLAQIPDADSLPEEVLNDKEKLQEIIEQQDAQREHEEMILRKTEKALKDFERKRQRALDKGKRPPTLEPAKLLQDIEEQYGRKLPERSEKVNKMLEEEADDFFKMVDDSASNPASPQYWWKKWFEKVTTPLPTWTPGGRNQPKASVVDVLDDVAAELQQRGSHISADVDRATDALLEPRQTGRVADLGAENGSWPERDALLEQMRAEQSVAKTLTSPDVTDMEPKELGFPPYDRERPVPKHVPNEPSGRLAFPPYDTFEPVEDKARDAKMQGFPPYDGKGEIHDSETVGLPPYNKKKPHMGRGFPPYRDGKSVYKHRKEAVDEAVK